MRPLLVLLTDGFDPAQHPPRDRSWEGLQRGAGAASRRYRFNLWSPLRVTSGGWSAEPVLARPPLASGPALEGGTIQPAAATRIGHERGGGEDVARASGHGAPDTTPRLPRILLAMLDLPGSGGSGKHLRMAATLDALTAMGEVDVVVLADAERDTVLPPPGSDRVEIGGTTVVGLVQLAHQRPARSLVSAATGAVPWRVAVRDWATARTALSRLLRTDYDLVWFSSLDHADRLAGSVGARRVVVDADDVETAKAEAFLALPARGLGGRLERLQRRIEARLWARLQQRVADRADVVVVCSDLDVARFAGPRMAVLPNTLPDPGYRRQLPTAGPPCLLLAANYTYEPNHDAATHLAMVLWAHVRAQLPTAQLRLVGPGADRLDGLRGIEGVEVVGFVPDVARELARAAAIVTPIRYGGGTRLKVIEAFASGVPVVSTPLGCEGLGAVAGVHLEVAERPADFAAACARVVEDPSHAGRLTAAARRLYERDLTPEAGRRAVADIVRRALDPAAGAGSTLAGHDHA